MSHIVESVIDQLERGRMTRREAVASLTSFVAAATSGAVAAAAALAAPRTLAQEGGAPARTFQATGLNHIALRVTDIDRSVEFYRRHLGLGVLRRGSSNSFLSCGGNNFVALFRASAPGLDHYCYTIPDYDAASTVKTLNAAGLKNERHDDRVYFDDPDGLTVQLSGLWDDYPGPRPGS